MMQKLLLQSALELASFDLMVMPVHTVDPTGRCSCGCRKANCGSRGKHPRISDWQHKASSDEAVIIEWWDRWPLANIGVQWGPRSNAIDIEFDDEEGRRSADKFFGGIVTPSYESSRSVHRIFRHVPEFTGLGATKMGEKVEHLEFRIGADGKGAQSVLPPSRHHSGKTYRWFPSLSISDVEIAYPPRELIELITKWYAAKVNGSDTNRRSAAPLAERIPHGSRHTALVSLAGSMRRRGLVKEEIVPSLRAVAERRCEYVSGDEIDVETIAESVCQYEPGDPLLAAPRKLVESVRDDAASRLSPAVRRARNHAIEHRRKTIRGRRR